MTAKNGSVLPECAANMAVLEVAGKSFNTALGRLEEDYRATRDIVNQNTVVVADMKNLVIKELLPAVKALPQTIDGKIRYHEEMDPLHAAARTAQKNDITQKLSLVKSIPPEKPQQEERDKLKARLIQAGIAFLIAATSVLTTLAASN